MKSLSLDYIAGFIDGEGSFTYARDGGGNKIPRFSVSQNEKAIMEKIHIKIKGGRA